MQKQYLIVLLISMSIQTLVQDQLSGEGADITQGPVVGILSQTLEKDMKNDTRFSNYSSYMMASYVEFLQQAGARVVPLLINESEEVIAQKVSKLNGVLFPGGDGNNEDLTAFVFNLIKQINDNGTYYPIWATCMGYENMTVIASETGKSLLGIYDYSNGSLPLEFVMDPRDTQMYGWLQDQAFFFEDHDMTYNSHYSGIDPDAFRSDSKLNEMFEITAISYMPDGRPFVASIEGKKYPFFGTQFHPEKTTQIFLDDHGINHTWLSIQLNRVFSDYFIYLTRHNTNSYGNFSNTQKDIVQNYDIIVTDLYESTVYVFP